MKTKPRQGEPTGHELYKVEQARWSLVEADRRRGHAASRLKKLNVSPMMTIRSTGWTSGMRRKSTGVGTPRSTAARDE
jgi:hypothetical protein